MKAKADVDAGVCGFRTHITATCEDGQMVAIEIASGCEKIREFARQLAEKGAVDAFQEISPVGESVILSVARAANKGCCAACAVPVAAFKSMQVAAGLALPQSIVIGITKE